MGTKKKKYISGDGVKEKHGSARKMRSSEKGGKGRGRKK